MSTPFATASERLNKEFINLSHIENLKVSLSYNGTNNFMNEDLYKGFHHAFLHQLAFEKMQIASQYLKNNYPELKFLVFDALRPRSVQVKMRKHVEHTPYKDYVADPKLGSLHNFGMAIDLTLIDKSEKELDMGTPFDDFAELAQPKLEEKFLREGLLTAAQMNNRMILRNTMLAGGFTQLPHEWWHYNAFANDHVRKNFLIVE